MKLIKHIISTLFISIFLLFWSCSTIKKAENPISLSGIYPHLAMYNNEGECGTGAVVPWADRLWVVTYGPHLPNGSSDKLYEIDSDLKQTIRPESIGGTPANRMIHKESQQLFIGPYAINQEGNVRTIPYTSMPGRMTGNARHLTKPADFIYYGTMEEGFYEVNVKTLDVHTLYEDANSQRKAGQLAQHGDLLPGAHGKGLYSGQGVMVYSNNGEATKEALHKFDVESGALLEWNGKDWKLVRRNQFTEVTGPGGIYGNENPDTDPIWTVGWDHKSLLLGVREPEEGWSFYRLPKASHSYDGAHGWNTEWPRIRDVGVDGKEDYLMTMHGLFWHFPKVFTKKNTAGIRPRSAYLKVIGDFTRWNDQLVFGTDDSAQKEFLNKRSAKGSIEGPGQSNSNLWFTSVDQPDQLGPNTSEGAVWLDEKVIANAFSEPFLFAGWSYRAAWIHNQGTKSSNFLFEVDQDGKGNWKEVQNVTVKGGASSAIHFGEEINGEWIRVKSDINTTATVHFFYTDEDKRKITSDKIFTGLSRINESHSIGGLLYGLGDNRRALGVSALNYEIDKAEPIGYYELNEKLELVRKEDAETDQLIQQKFAIPQKAVILEESSVLIVDDAGRRWRLPLGDEMFRPLTEQATLRICREVATERDLFNCQGTFYELPAENADGYAKIRPVASHDFRINDYTSYRGMLILSGIDPDRLNKNENPHILVSNDKKAAVWAGAIDDLWKIGKPRGHGGPWKDTKVKNGEYSDPYLIGFYQKRKLDLYHQGNETVKFTIEVDPIGQGNWMEYKEVTLSPNEHYIHDFTEDLPARWIRFKVDKACSATASLVYN